MHGFKLPVVLAPLLYAVGSAAGEDVSVLSKETAKANNESLLWGPYKPNLYFGVRPRLPDSFFAGLMWAKVDDFVSAQQSRCPCLSTITAISRLIGSSIDADILKILGIPASKMKAWPVTVGTNTISERAADKRSTTPETPWT